MFVSRTDEIQSHLLGELSHILPVGSESEADTRKTSAKASENICYVCAFAEYYHLLICAQK